MSRSNPRFESQWHPRDARPPAERCVCGCSLEQHERALPIHLQLAARCADAPPADFDGRGECRNPECREKRDPESKAGCRQFRRFLNRRAAPIGRAYRRRWRKW